MNEMSDYQKTKIALEDISSGRGICIECGILADMPSNCVSCDDYKKCTWGPIDPACLAKRVLSKLSVSDVEEHKERERCAQIADQYECGLDHYPSHEARTHYEQGVIDTREGIAKAIIGEAKEALAYREELPRPPVPKFGMGDHVQKVDDASWKGHIIGVCSMNITGVWYQVESHLDGSENGILEASLTAVSKETVE